MQLTEIFLARRTFCNLGPLVTVCNVWHEVWFGPAFHGSDATRMTKRCHFGQMLKTQMTLLPLEASTCLWHTHVVPCGVFWEPHLFTLSKKKKKKASSLSCTKHIEHMSFLTFAKTIRNILNRALFTTMFASSEPFPLGLFEHVAALLCDLTPQSKKSDTSGRSVYHLCAQYHKNRDTLVETLLHSDVQWPLSS